MNAINNIIDMEKQNYALPLYHLMLVSILHDSTFNFIISDSAFKRFYCCKSKVKT